MSMMKEWDIFLSENGANVFTPKDCSDAPEWSGSTEEQKAIALRLSKDHFDRISNYDVVFIFNVDGYCGVSTTMEIGCAYGNKKEIYALSSDRDEICRDILFSKICQTKKELLTVLSND